MFNTPTLIVSKCINNNPCRYDGSSSPCEYLNTLSQYINIIEICPEQAIGLNTPRNPIRLVGSKENHDLIMPGTNEILTNKMKSFCNIFKEEYSSLDGFLLKSRSPSCGINDVKIYSSSEKGPCIAKGKGIFGEFIVNNFINIPIEDDGRLNNFSIRENFFTRIFTIASFKEVLKSNSISKLLDFHTNNKLLFMSYSQSSQKKLGKLVANHEQNPTNLIFEEYYKGMLNLLKTPPKYTSRINTLNHALGYFDSNLKICEKEYFSQILDNYRYGKIPLSVPISLLKSYSLRFNNKYLLQQTFLNPYPEELISISDSGKGR